MTTDQKGSIAETAIIHAATKLGIGVYKPLTDGHQFDLIFDVVERLLRVQCKWAPRRGDVVVIRCRTSRRTREGIVHRPYRHDELDAFAAYCAELDRCFFVPVESWTGRTDLALRLAPTRNNQQAGINWASDFDFAARLGRLGP